MKQNKGNNENENKNPLPFTFTYTAHLYEKEEVRKSLQTAIIKNNTSDKSSSNFNEILFWAFEYYTSGYEEECFEFIFQIFYDFFAIQNPKLESYIQKKYTIWKTLDNKHSDEALSLVITILKNLTSRNITAYSFIVRHYFEKQKSKRASQPIPPTKKEIPPESQPSYFEFLSTITTQELKNLIQSIENFNIQQIVYNLVLCKNTDSVYITLIKYYASKNKVAKKQSLKTKDILKTINEQPYKNINHIIITIILHMKADEENINTNKQYKKNTIKELEYIKNTFFSPPKLIRKTLEEKRHYGVDLIIGYNLPRFSIPRDENDTLMNYIYHWEYYAYNCPLWKSRIEKYQGTPNKKTRTIAFPTEEQEEQFYEKYDYNHDEETFETQNKSVSVEMERSSLVNYISTLFSKEQLKVLLL
jgi:hypothetical protein